MQQGILGEEHSEQKLKTKTFLALLSTSLNYYSTTLTAQAGPNYTSHFVKVPSCSICSMHVWTGSNMHARTHAPHSTSDRQTKAGQGTLSHLDMPLSTRTAEHLNHQSSVAVRETLWLKVARWLQTWIQRAVHLFNSQTQLMPWPRSGLWPSACTSLKTQGLSWQFLCMYGWGCTKWEEWTLGVQEQKLFGDNLSL